MNYFYDMIDITYELTDEQKQMITTKFPAPTFPEAIQGVQLNQLTKGNSVKARVLLNEFEVKKTKTNKSFLKVQFSDQSGTISAKMWDNNGEVEQMLPILDQVGVFDIRGQVDEFNGFKSVTIYEMTPCEEKIDPSTLLAYTKQDIEALTEELFAYLLELKKPYQDIAIKAMEHLWEAFRISPAAKGFHHNYLGGLLKHTIGLMRFCRYITVQSDNPFRAVMKLIHKVETEYKQEIWNGLKEDNPRPSFVWKDTIDHLYHMLLGMAEYKYEDINYDALMTSILFHDIGKLAEYDYAGKSIDIFHFLFPTAAFENGNRKQAGIAMDPLGVTVGHIPYGVLVLSQLIEKENISISMEAIHLMTHCILCHHGLPEWGSAVRKPTNLEGYIIHIVDYLDSRYENTEADEEK
ncbi:hydrolase [Gracilibacillus caseinilyticus]|uniref:Hydrolase n=1 Tax=Gracilibacillus caseinilyticus TaxID=2932256 RepID=A0ABY4ERU1_9BACI|nr:hydrolase [Gracilibacillus caseinilyticus]UOQ46801.1 hydrolase [Gracilibacillus caseinilyticus]